MHTVKDPSCILVHLICVETSLHAVKSYNHVEIPEERTIYLKTDINLVLWWYVSAGRALM